MPRPASVVRRGGLVSNVVGLLVNYVEFSCVYLDHSTLQDNARQFVFREVPLDEWGRATLGPRLADDGPPSLLDGHVQAIPT